MRVKKPEANWKLEQVNMIVAFDYKTDGDVNMQMETLAVAQVHIPAHSMSVSATKLRTSGTLRFSQTEAVTTGVGSGVSSTLE